MPHVAIVTAYHREPHDVLQRMRASVLAQQTTLEVRHYMVADGLAQPHWDAREHAGLTHLALPRSHDDHGDSPRLMGAMLAIREDCVGLMFLDADNLLYPNHVQQAWETRQKSGLDVVIARRDMLRPDGTALPAHVSDDQSMKHVDTGCFFFFGDAVFHALDWARIPRDLSAIGDRVFWSMLNQREPRFAVMRTATVGYTSLWRKSYELAGEPPPPGAKDLVVEVDRIDAWWRGLPPQERRRLDARMKGWFRPDLK